MIKDDLLKKNYLKFLDDWLAQIKYTPLKIDRFQKKISDSNDETEIIRFEGRIKSYTTLLETCDRLYNMLDEELKEIFNLRYSRGSCLTWREIAIQTHISERGIYRKRAKLLEIFAEEIGII